MRSRKIIALVAAGAIVAAASLAYAADQNNRYGTVPCPAESAIVSSNIAPTATVGFTKIEEIIANSDAIIIADVDKCVKVHSHPKDKEIRLTDIEVTPEETITGDLQAGKPVTVQLVTSGEGAEDHPMHEGERYILFLTFNQITSSYVPVGGPQGRFLIADDRVYSMDSKYPNLTYINVKMNGEPLDDLVSRIRTITGQ
jgi:hypothetical protein